MAIRCAAFILLAWWSSAQVLADAPSFEGFTEPFRKIDVAAAETGTVAKVCVHEGDAVTRGQVLATLDNEVLKVSREIAISTIEARGKLTSATAERDLRKTRLAQLEILRPQGHASQEEIDRARTDLEVAEANLLAVQEQRQLDELERRKIDAMIERRTLRSAIDGVVSKILKDENEFVSANSAAVLTVVQLSPLRVTFSLPTSAAAMLSSGQVVPLELADEGTKLSGKVEFIAPVTEAESGTVRVKVLIDNPKRVVPCGVRCLMNVSGNGRVAKTAKVLDVGPPQK